MQIIKGMPVPIQHGNELSDSAGDERNRQQILFD